MPLFPILMVVAPATLAAAPQGGSLEIENLGFDLSTQRELVFDHGLLAFDISEQSAAVDGIDLNGDGDTFDRVVQVLDVASNQLTNTGLAGEAVALHGRWLVVHQFESYASQDLNGDGDTNDTRILGLFDVISGQSTNLALYAPAVDSDADEGGQLLSAMVDEFRQGADLNGDGDLEDVVLHAVDLTTGAATNLGTATSGVAVGLGGIAYTVRELGELTDFNGDGDNTDHVLHFFDGASGSIVSTGLAVTFNALDAHANGLFTSVVREADAGGVDLNGDGDALDKVLHLHTLPGPTTVNLGWSVGQVEGSSKVLAFAVRESEQGASDLNGDGDSLDDVLYVRDLSTGATQNLGLAVWFFPPLQVEGSRVSLAVPEAGQGAQDLNGDGDLLDSVLALRDDATGLVTLLPFATGAAARRGSKSSFEVFEHQQGADLDGDGDSNDRLVASFDAATGLFSFTADNATGPIIDGGLVLCVGSELADSYLDANGDGDGIDYVPRVIDPSTGTVVTIPLAIETDVGSDPIALDGRRLALLVNEKDQGGTDLNGDGDVYDDVLHLVTLPFDNGLVSDADSASIAAAGSQGFAFEGGVEHASQGYLLLGSASGTTPGIQLGPVTLPLVLDAYTMATLTAPGLAPFTASFGLLDEFGRTSAPSIDLPAGLAPALAGTVLHHAIAVLDLGAGAATIDASNAVPLTLVN